MNKRVIFALAFILSIGAFFVLPVDDDFYYFTAPHADLCLKDLLPHKPFWRPFDVLFGVFLGKCPTLFPYLNHAIVLAGFAYSIYGLNKILNYCGTTKTSQNIALAMFCLSPALVATTFSVDSSNQSLSLALGIASLIYFEKHKCWSYTLMLLAVFAKESGIAWFAITPLLNLLIQYRHSNISQPIAQNIKSLIRPWCISLCIIAVYAIARIYLDTHIGQSADSNGRYSTGIGVNSLVGFGMILTSAITSIDTIALFLEKNWFIVTISTIVSAAFLFIIIKKISWREHYSLIILAICILAISSPHLVMQHPGEMHVYPTLWMIALSFGLQTFGWTKRELSVMYIYFACSILVFIHKGYYIYNIGKIAASRVQSVIGGQARTIPNKVLILDCDPQLDTYSVFQTNRKKSWDGGKGTRVYWDLKNPEHIDYKVINPQQLKQNLTMYKKSPKGKYDVCWIVKSDKVQIVE